MNYEAVKQRGQLPPANGTASGEKAVVSPLSLSQRQMVEENLGLVGYVVGRMAGTVQMSERDDIISMGNFGLIDAVRNFDPERGTRFSTYAVRRIRGAILDGLRSLDVLPKKTRMRVKQIDSVSVMYLQENGREPTDEELSEMTGLKASEINYALKARSKSAVSLSGVNRFKNDDVESQEPPSDDGPPDEKLDDLIAIGDISEIIGEKLSERERRMLGLYYKKGMSGAAIAGSEGVSERRVLQLIQKAKGKIKKGLEQKGYKF